MSATGYLAVGYGLIWVIIAVYIAYMGRRQAGLRRQLESLRGELSDSEGDGEEGLL
jgi:CcmD family protein